MGLPRRRCHKKLRARPGRWRRLNYDRLGQPILDAGFMGMMTKVHTFNDLSDWGLQETWGQWSATQRRTAALAHSNPYATLVLTDRFGPRKLMGVAAFLCAFASMAFALSDSLWAASLARALVGATVASGQGRRLDQSQFIRGLEEV